MPLKSQRNECPLKDLQRLCLGTGFIMNPFYVKNATGNIPKKKQQATTTSQ